MRTKHNALLYIGIAVVFTGKAAAEFPEAIFLAQCTTFMDVVQFFAIQFCYLTRGLSTKVCVAIDPRFVFSFIDKQI